MSKDKYIVGLDIDGEYLPMMWETYAVASPDDKWFDFKYINGRNPWGLNKAAVFVRADLNRIFALYQEKTGNSVFP